MFPMSRLSVWNRNGYTKKKKQLLRHVSLEHVPSILKKEHALKRYLMHPTKPRKSNHFLQNLKRGI